MLQKKKKTSQGLACDCDAGYSGYDCSGKSCPYGIDPLFVDDSNTARMPEWTIEFMHSSDLVSEIMLTRKAPGWRLFLRRRLFFV